MGKKIFISQDMEGMSGVANFRGADLAKEGDDYENARQWATGDVNAAIEGAIEGGADDFTVREAHHGLIYHKLHPKAKLVKGMPSSIWTMDGLDSSFDAVMCVGFHARSGDGRGVLSHTWTGSFLDVSINGLLMSEARIGALIAGYYDVPVVMLAGDDVICTEVQDWLPGIETAVVKYALNRSGAICPPIDEAHAVIRAKAKAGMAKIDQMKPYKIDPPYTLEIETVNPSYAQRMSLMPGSEYDGKRKVRYTCDDFLENHRAFLTMVFLSGTAGP